MDLSELKSAFDRHTNEHLHFERIESPRHPRPDLCAFLMLHDIAPGKPYENGQWPNIVSAAMHDEFFLATNPEDLAEAVTDEQVRDLVRCGVMFDTATDSLSMFA